MVKVLEQLWLMARFCTLPTCQYDYVVSKSKQWHVRYRQAFLSLLYFVDKYLYYMETKEISVFS